ncbi:MAG TPA: hypothetical protein VN515_00030 [Terriglobales bacterium]|nr:hypothetical protein [Terriglobales bacterium]
MHPSTTDILLIVFIALAAVALLGQWLAFLGIARKVSALSEAITPLLPAVQQSVHELHAIAVETRPKLLTVTSNVAEITTLAREQLQRADAFATDFGQRLELQMVRVDEALGTALASVEQITTSVRDTILRPVQDVNAVFQGVRTGLDFFFRRRPSPSVRPVYQDEEMFI